jgi:hypothetical protein
VDVKSVFKLVGTGWENSLGIRTIKGLENLFYYYSKMLKKPLVNVSMPQRPATVPLQPPAPGVPAKENPPPIPITPPVVLPQLVVGQRKPINVSFDAVFLLCSNIGSTLQARVL